MAELTQKQTEQYKLFNSGAAFICCYGGASSGKTFGICVYLITCALSVPNSTYLICRANLSDAVGKVYEETIKAVINIFYPELEGEVKFRGQPYHALEFPNGSSILFGGVKDNEQLDKVLGRRYTKIFINEASQVRSYNTFSTLISRLGEKNALSKQLIIDLNPVANNHWTYRLFVEKINPSNNKPINNPEDYQYIQMNPADNLENIDASVIKAYDNASETERQRFLFGEWADSGDIVVIQPNWLKRYKQIPSYNYVVQSWDTGQKDKDFHDPSACITWGIGRDGYYILDIVNKRIEYPTLKNFIYEHANNWRANEVLIEDKGSGISLIQDLKYQTRLPVVGFNPGKTGKTVRAATAAQFFEKGLVYLPDSHDLVDDYISQLLMFPFTEHDDMVDATSNFLLYAQERLWDFSKELDIYDDEDDTDEDEYLMITDSPTGY